MVARRIRWAKYQLPNLSFQMHALQLFENDQELDVVIVDFLVAIEPLDDKIDIWLLLVLLIYYLSKQDLLASFA